MKKPLDLKKNGRVMLLMSFSPNSLTAIEIWQTLPYYGYEKVGNKIMDKEQQHQEDLQRIRGFRLIDDDFMNA